MRGFGLLIILLCQWCVADVLVRVRPHVVVTPDSQVTMAQLIDAQGLSQETTSLLATMILTKAPEYGEKIELANASITQLLRPLMQDERRRNASKLQLIVPKVVHIDTTKRGLEKDLVLLELQQAWQPLCADCRLEIEGLSLPKVEGIRDWTLRLKAELPRGSFSLPVDLIRENGSMSPAWVSGRLVTKRQVPVAKRAIAASERLTAADFSWEFRDTSYAVDGIPVAEEMVGRRMKQGLRAGDILWKGMVEKEKAIRRGDMVQLKSSEGSWEVTLRVISEQDGYIGDLINMKNPTTNNKLVGQVVGQGEVELR